MSSATQSRELQVVDAQVAPALDFNPTQLDILRQTIAAETSDLEFQLFVEVAKRLGLDPFMRQIHAVMRNQRDGDRWVKRMTIQTGIDGYRLLASRTRELAGIDDAEFGPEDGEGHPSWARVTVWRFMHGQRIPFTATARWREYVQVGRDGQPTGMWAKMPYNQLSKCFSADTEVLTEFGFRRFPDVGDARIIEVTNDGPRAVRAVPFVQPYDGPMIISNGDMLNFAVTPNHDMITTFGKVEAGAMYATSKANGHSPWRIPMTAQGRTDEADISDDDLRLAGYILADGSHNGYQRFNVQVSRAYKREELEKLSPASTGVMRSRGATVAVAERTITTNFDKMHYSFECERVARVMDHEKRLHTDFLLTLGQRQARILLDAWQEFDGYTNRKTGVRRLYTSRSDHRGAVELLAALAGYSVNTPRIRHSDLSDRPNFSLTISEPKPIKVMLPIGDHPGVVMEPNESGEVWCVTVPGGVVIVRRRGFAMLCGNCAEALALRRGFPAELSGLYTNEEMAQADNPLPTPIAPVARITEEHPSARRPNGGSNLSATESTQTTKPWNGLADAKFRQAIKQFGYVTVEQTERFLANAKRFVPNLPDGSPEQARAYLKMVKADAERAAQADAGKMTEQGYEPPTDDATPDEPESEGDEEIAYDLQRNPPAALRGAIVP